MAHFELTEELKEWFAKRMSETASGRVQVTTAAYNKYKRLAENDCISNGEIKCILIDEVYNA